MFLISFVTNYNTLWIPRGLLLQFIQYILIAQKGIIYKVVNYIRLFGVRVPLNIHPISGSKVV